MLDGEIGYVNPEGEPIWEPEVADGMEPAAPNPPAPTGEAHFDDGSYIALVPLNKIIYEPYCRPFSEARINKMIREGFDRSKLGTPTMSLRLDGWYASVDGRHRADVMRRLGYTAMYCRVYEGQTYEQEALQYDGLNTMNRPIALDRFRARYEAKEPREIHICEILGRYGIHVAMNDSSHGGGTRAVGALIKLYDEQGPIAFEEVVSILSSTWGIERRAWVAPMIDGMRQFWMRYRAQVKRARLIDRLKLLTPDRILAQSGFSPVKNATTASLVGRVLVAQYNSGLRHGSTLPEWVERPGTTPKITEPLEG